jgi:hypothetical protein
MSNIDPRGWEALAIRLAGAHERLQDLRIQLAEAIQHSPRVFSGATDLQKALVMLGQAHDIVHVWNDWARVPGNAERKERIAREEQEEHKPPA